MRESLSNLAHLLYTLDPVLHDGVYVYSSIPAGTDLNSLPVVAFIHETEGVSVVLPEASAIKACLPVFFRAAWITLTVQSDLQAVGLTAAVASALGAAGISCNVVAGAFHDHLFVPVERSQEALAALRKLQSSAQPEREALINPKTD